MALQIYNSQAQKKEEFKPLKEGEVSMYVCGPTVYDYLHVGNFRGAIFFNLVRNWLEKKGYKVKYVYNYTDVDDRILNRAKEEGVESSVISERYIKEFEKDYNDLRLRPHSANPRVSEHMDDITDFVKELVEKNKAYVIDGDVYYDVKAFENYGKLSHKNLDDMEAGFRIEVDSRKKHPADFALWKSAKPGEASWPSPWGQGRPGWHIECSAMIRALLGDSIDIHGGGMDLIFPHHENEVAQSEGCSGKQFVRYWMHNNMFQFGNQKMSKSVGNTIKGRDFISKYNAEILKFMTLSAHYRSQVDLSDEQVEHSISGLARIYSAMAWAEANFRKNSALAPAPATFQKTLQEADDRIAEALDDDFNTAEVMARIFEVIRQFNTLCRVAGKLSDEKIAACDAFYHWINSKGKVMALFQESPSQYLQKLDDMLLEKKNLSRSEIDKKVTERSQARANKDYALSDKLRGELTELGIQIRDTAEGTEWEVNK